MYWTIEDGLCALVRSLVTHESREQRVRHWHGCATWRWWTHCAHLCMMRHGLVRQRPAYVSTLSLNGQSNSLIDALQHAASTGVEHLLFTIQGSDSCTVKPDLQRVSKSMLKLQFLVGLTFRDNGKCGTKGVKGD